MALEQVISGLIGDTLTLALNSFFKSRGCISQKIKQIETVIMWTAVMIFIGALVLLTLNIQLKLNVLFGTTSEI